MKSKRKIMFISLVLSFVLCLGLSIGVLAQEKVEIELWSFGGLDTELKYIPEKIEEFESENPDIDIVLSHYPWDDRREKIITAYQQNKLPDLIMTGSPAVPNFAEMGILTAYDEEFPEYYEEWESRFVPEVWEEVSTYKGHKYGVTPYCAMGPMMIFKPSILKEAGLEDMPKNWSDLITYAKEIKKEVGINGISLAASKATNDMQTFMDIAYRNGGRWLNEEGDKVVINGPGVVDTLKLYEKLYNQELIQSSSMQTDYIDALKLIVQEQAGIAFGKDWVYGIVYDLGAEEDEIFTLSQFPQPEDVTGNYESVSATLEGGSDLMMTSTSEHKEEAIKFVDFWTTPQVTKGWGGDPIRGRVPGAHAALKSEAFKENNPYLYELYKEGKLFDNAISAPSFRGLGEMYAYLADAIQDVFLGQATPQEALDEAQRESQNILDRYNR